MNFDIKKPIEMASLGDLKQLFYADFENGFNTYTDWSLLRRDTSDDPSTVDFSGQMLNLSVNDTAYSLIKASGNRYLSATIQPTAPTDNLFTANSLANIKIPRNGLTFLFMHLMLPSSVGAADDNEVYLNITGPGVSPVEIFQGDWNIDGFGFDGNSKHPSGVTLNFDNPQTIALIQVNGGNDGLLLSFVVDGKIYPAHFLDANNIQNLSSAPSAQALRFLSNSIGFQCAKTDGDPNDFTDFDFGYISSRTSFTFSVRRDFSQAQADNYQIYSMTCVTTGDIENIDQTQFSASSVDASNGFSYTQVTSDASNLLEVYPNTYDANDLRDSTSFSIDKIEVSAVGPDLDQGCLVEFGYERFTGNDSTGSIAVSADSSLRKVLPNTRTTSMRVLDSFFVNVSTSKGEYTGRNIDVQKFPFHFGMVVVQWGTVRYFLRNRAIVAIRGRNPSGLGTLSMHASAVINGYEQT